MKIETKRLIIRPFQEKDLDVFVAYRNNEDWMVYQDFKGYTKDEYAKMIIDDLPDIQKGVQLAIKNRLTDGLLGDIFLNQVDNYCWLGYTIHPKYSRKGYIYEAINGIIDWLKTKHIHLIKACTHPKNEASIQLLIKLGFQPDGMLEEDLAFKLHI